LDEPKTLLAIVPKESIDQDLLRPQGRSQADPHHRWESVKKMLGSRIG
jgi:hypothetical protein